MEEAGRQAAWVDGERGAVLPALAERRLDVVHGRALDGHLDVVPGGRRAVGLGELHRLGVAAVVVVVAPPVTQVDPADVRDVSGVVVTVPDDDELLVVGAAGPHAHVPQALPARLVDLLAQLAVSVCAVAETVPVRAPQQPADIDAALHRRDERGAERRARVVGEQLVGFALPVGEVEAVARTQVADALVELCEIGTPVHDGADGVAGAPGGAVAADVVDARVRVLPLLLGQGPLLHVHFSHPVCLVKARSVPDLRFSVTDSA